MMNCLEKGTGMGLYDSGFLSGYFLLWPPRCCEKSFSFEMGYFCLGALEVYKHDPVS